jgi:hypothetical protein
MSTDSCEKTSYTGRRSARRTARLLSSETSEKFRAYYCSRCRKWHVTSQRRNERIPLKSKKQWVKRGRQPGPGQTLEELAAEMRGGGEE